MIKPNLFIVGAAKSGTTTVYKYLKQHRKIFVPEDELYKEPAFFSKKGENMGIDNYLNIFKKANKQHIYVGEASTAYLTDEQSAQKIFAFNPDSKIIIILRNPVDRAYSLYNWMVQEGYEYASSFEIALQLEKKRKNKKIPNFLEPEYYWNYMYFESGLYYEQVYRYIKLFDKNVKVIIFEEMIQNINKTLKETCEFLEIEYEEHKILKENESKRVILPLLQFSVRKINNVLLKGISLFKDIKTKQERDFLIYLFQLNKKPQKIDKNLRNKLLNLYSQDIGKLEELLNRDLSIWR